MLGQMVESNFLCFISLYLLKKLVSSRFFLNVCGLYQVGFLKTDTNSQLSKHCHRKKKKGQSCVCFQAQSYLYRFIISIKIQSSIKEYIF